ncbi:hypothetical protein AXX17_AT5G48160 [Arabidopsis thaliana]|uniref:Serine/threonine-protein phosphatase 4 regulatory subunit 3-like central domain-containing protein n=1 Tax=Arabidopsis thaliana TaxID=3702 RepID=A0A178UCD8_ARATH|nr:hypothetical protein AXX17_AT5G48160 [Arabidopsis thaliana]
MLCVLFFHTDDPDVPQSKDHRTSLRKNVVFVEDIPIKNPLVLSKIHQTYRIDFLKDVVLTDVLDVATSAFLDSVINANKATVLTLLKDDIQESFARLRSPSTSDESRNNLVFPLHEASIIFLRLWHLVEETRANLVYFLIEFCSLCTKEKNVSVLRELIRVGLFDIIAEVLMSSDKKLVLMGAKILSVLLAQDSIRLCSYVVRPETYLLGLLVKGMMEDFGDEMESLFVDIIQNVLGCGGAQVSDKKTNMQRIIWDIFCEKHLPELVDFIMASCPERPGDTSEGAFVRVGSHRGTKPGILLRICELLCSCVQLDPSRTNFLHNSVIEKVLLLTRRKEKTLVAAAVRFVRTLLSVHNDNVQSYIVENNTLKPIIEVFVANRHRDNLMTAAVLELLEHIRKEYAVLVKYVGDTFWDQLAPFENLRSIKDLKTKYEKGPKSTTDDESDMRQDGRALDEKKPASASSTQMEEADPHNSNATAASSASSTQMEDAEPYNPDVTAASSTCSTQMEVAEPYNPGVTAASSTSSTQMEEADPYNPDVTAASSTSITPMEVAEPYNPDVTAASSVSPSKRSGGLVDYEDDEDELEKSKRQKLSSTSEGNKNTPEQGGEAKEPGEL